MPPKGRKGTSAVIKDEKLEKVESDGEESKDPETKTNDKTLSKDDEEIQDDSATISEDNSKERKRDTKRKSYAELSEEEEDSAPKKRASRAVKPKAKLLDDSEEEEEEEDESEDEYVPPSASPRGKGKAPPRKRKGDDSDDSGSYGKKTKRSRKPARKPKKKSESELSEEEGSDEDWGSKKSGGRSKGPSRSRKTPVATPTRRGERNRGKQKVTSYAEDDDEESDGPSAKVEPKSRAVEKKVKASRKVEEEVKSEGDDKDESEEELKETPSKQANGKKSSDTVKAVDSENGLKDEVDEVEEDEEMEESKQPSAKRKAEKTEKVPAKKPADALDFSSLDFSCDKKTPDGKQWNLKISSWNVAGLRAVVKKNGLDYINYEKPDIFCLQEIKCPEKKLPSETKVEGYHAYWSSGERDGYGGTGLYSKEKPLDVKYGIGKPEFDEHGRVITAEYEKFYLVNVYVPNSGRGLVNLEKRKEWDIAFREYLKDLDEKKPVILTGDLNVAHQPIDLANPKTNTKNAGFTQEERDGFTKLLEEGFVDSFRQLYPDKKDTYTFWTNMKNAREKNVGWRLDYFVISKKLIPGLCESTMRSQVFGSDHCPITLFLNV
ncbi:DNA-(apurinic or apyrimidinic site) endonuclease [Ischnura elegans]|uniref:DNA-(apurinic or apyrimidinic site) endonuclease n=1 Tax=Ischnura elegans TaxID=197161 RepID=UPI001ED8A5F1|nr:DNA-(apurinic or apyrimidinic site) endonuclease [Ischnura elegans]